MRFEYPFVLALVLLVIPLLAVYGSRRKTVGHPQVKMHAAVKSVAWIAWIPKALFALTWILLICALARPQQLQVNEKQVVQSRDFILVVDVSGSMGSTLSDGKNQESAPGVPTPQPVTKAMAAKSAVESFLAHRQGDRVGLMTFDDRAYYDWPLSRDLRIIALKLVHILYSGSGTNFDGPREPGQDKGGLQAAIDHFRELSKVDTTKVLVIVTDAEDDIAPERFAQLSQEMKDLHIRIYAIGVGESWFKTEKTDLQKFVEGLHGVVIPVGNDQAMQAAFDTIDRLEKSDLAIDVNTTKIDLFYWFIAAGILTGSLFLLASSIAREDV